MSIVKVNQSRLMPRFSDVWESLLSRDLADKMHWHDAATVPAVNIVEKPHAFEVTLAAPGMQREDFKIEINNGILSVSSEKEEKYEEKDKEDTYTRREFSYHAFSRSFTLPEVIDEAKIAAQYKDGILCIALPKKKAAETAAPKHIAVH